MDQRVTRRALLALLGGAGAMALGGCRRARASTPITATATQAGRSVQELTVGGVARRYVRYEPPGLDPVAPVPLVLVLHGRGSNGTQAERLYDMREQSDAHGFVVAYPDALGTPPGWNAGLGGVDSRTDDVGFIRALVDREAGTRAIDPRRTFVCGHSSGGIMAYKLAGEASDLFPAIGVVAGAIGYRLPSGSLLTIPTPERPVSVIHFHGTDDPLVPYAGGASRWPVRFVSVADSIGFWVAQDGCDPAPTGETIGVSRRETYGGGHDGSVVTLWTIQGGGHGWPKTSGFASVAVSPAGISATELIWAFFADHPRSP